MDGGWGGRSGWRTWVWAAGSHVYPHLLGSTVACYSIALMTHQGDRQDFFHPLSPLAEASSLMQVSVGAGSKHDSSSRELYGKRSK